MELSRGGVKGGVIRGAAGVLGCEYEEFRVVERRIHTVMF